MPKTKLAKKKIADQVDRHVLYQQSVQNSDFELEFVQARFEEIRGRKPYSMREDFSGTSISSVTWVGKDEANTALAVDIDADVLEWGRLHNLSQLSAEQQQRIELRQSDVLELVDGEQFDFIQAFNFSYWCFQERKVLLDYFRKARESLVDDGILFLDVYGGHEAYQVQKEKRDVGDFTYIWEQAEFNAVTYEQKCHIHFKFEDGSKLKKAFSYVWRIWGAKELRDILEDAGFSKSTLYIQAFDEETDEPLDEYIATDEALDYACWLGYLVAEK